MALNDLVGRLRAGRVEAFCVAADITDYERVQVAVERGVGEVRQDRYPRQQRRMGPRQSRSCRRSPISGTRSSPSTCAARLTCTRPRFLTDRRRAAGKVVNIASDAGRVGSSGESVYSACKGGLIAFSKTIAREYARDNIRVNVVCPGPTDTALLRSFVGDGEYGQKLYERLRKSIPLKRLGQPDDIPGLVAFLSSDDARFMTGQVVSISGGLTMHG